MKLSSTPKPVRIRISLCGKEHTSLESLKENISPDILQFTDGRLQRWLKQQNLNELSENIDKIAKNERKDSRTKLLNLYNRLNDKSHENLLCYIDEWKNDIKSKELLKFYFKEFGNDVNVLENNIKIFSLDEWYEIISPWNDSQLDFFLAKKYEKKGDIEQAIRILCKIKERDDCPEAVSYYKKGYESQIPTQQKGAYCLFDNSEWEFREIVNDFSKFQILEMSDDFSRISREIIEFIRACDKIYSGQESLMLENFDNIYRTPFDGIYLRNERLCLMSVIMGSSSKYSSRCPRETIIRCIDKEHPFKKKVKGFFNTRKSKALVREIVEYILLEKVYS